MSDDSRRSSFSGTVSKTVTLSTFDPTAPQNHVLFDHARAEFISDPLEHRFIELFSQYGGKYEDRGSSKMNRWSTVKSSFNATLALSSKTGERSLRHTAQNDGENEDGKVKNNEPKQSRTTPRLTAEQTAVKHFNALIFSERLSQTPRLKSLNAETQTVSHRRTNFGETVSAWRIYDAYISDLQTPNENESFNCDQTATTQFSKGADNTESKKVSFMQNTEFLKNSDSDRHVDFLTPADNDSTNDAFTDDLAQLVGTVRIMERIVLQNCQQAIIHDYRYYDDPSDDLNEKEGHLLPLWKISTFDMTRGVPVTGIFWSQIYPDLLVVTFGSITHLEHHLTTSVGKISKNKSSEKNGILCIYSLTNTVYPEHYWFTDSGVMCADLHKRLVCAGMRDGRVCVLAVEPLNRRLITIGDSARSACTRKYNDQPLNNRHSDRVTSVRWLHNDVSASDNSAASHNAFSFYSSSIDGDLCVWLLEYGELRRQFLVSLLSSRWQSKAPILDGDTGITALALTRISPETTVCAIGTGRGDILCCSLRSSCATTAVESQTKIPSAHGHIITALDWNSYNKSLLMSGGADWRVLVWQCCQTRCDENDDSKHDDSSISEVGPSGAARLVFSPLAVYDLGCAVNSAVWAPHSSTVMAAASEDGFVHIFDVSLDLCHAVCRQPIVDGSRAKLTQLAFSSVGSGQPSDLVTARPPVVIAAGDSRGVLNILKLSPNLRRLSKEAKNADTDRYFQLELDKLNRIFNIPSAE